MALSKIQSESINLADNFAFTGTVTGAGGTTAPYCGAYRHGDQNISDATWTKIQFNTEFVDSANAFDSSTNYRFKCDNCKNCSRCNNRSKNCR